MKYFLQNAFFVSYISNKININKNYVCKYLNLNRKIIFTFVTSAVFLLYVSRVYAESGSIFAPTRENADKLNVDQTDNRTPAEKNAVGEHDPAVGTVYDDEEGHIGENEGAVVHLPKCVDSAYMEYWRKTILEKIEGNAVGQLYMLHYDIKISGPTTILEGHNYVRCIYTITGTAYQQGQALTKVPPAKIMTQTMFTDNGDSNNMYLDPISANGIAELDGMVGRK